ncbi:MAG: hypothetical protein SNJ77_04370 [Cytophagales bacterium]
MAGCGYVCPVCEGKGFKDDLSECDFCEDSKNPEPEQEISEDDWLKSVHEGSCCSGD